ncbi:ABC transporter ATP-binding protein [Paenibacillus agricola]|uniref:ABC transporter ATP-binding protein n=1 Tax=Paenibacillus agricola TaxID=2716264 RepID=A0ABX0JE77_9BACL|nr:ABC transporter ATP-binding protein [Paenibacillus agricola]NHN34071.1 ABC transporter ATP-binding protein [Paenibacillus agricola]
MEALLKVRNLKTYFSTAKTQVKAVDGVDFEVRKGKVLCIVGESGSGKSMTSLSIMGLVPGPQGRIVDGEVLFEGQDLVKLNENEMSDLRGNKIAMIFQEPMSALNPLFKIGDQIIEVLMRHRKLTRFDALAKAIEQLRSVGFPKPENIVKSYPHQLSGGMRQRVMIAMMMACEPKLLIADEPTTALDVTIQAQVLDLMRNLKDQTGTSIIFITHDLGVVAEMADDMVVMYGGQIVESGLADVVFDKPLHPYTLALMGSIPSIHGETDRLTAIPGTVPSAANFPVGCRFAERCACVHPSCHNNMPELREISPGHFVRCDFV